MEQVGTYSTTQRIHLSADGQHLGAADVTIEYDVYVGTPRIAPTSVPEETVTETVFNSRQDAFDAAAAQAQRDLLMIAEADAQRIVDRETLGLTEVHLDGARA